MLTIFWESCQIPSSSTFYIFSTVTSKTSIIWNFIKWVSRSGKIDRSDNCQHIRHRIYLKFYGERKKCSCTEQARSLLCFIISTSNRYITIVMKWDISPNTVVVIQLHEFFQHIKFPFFVNLYSFIWNMNMKGLTTTY